MFRRAKDGAGRRHGRCGTSSANTTPSRRLPATGIPGRFRAHKACDREACRGPHSRFVAPRQGPCGHRVRPGRLGGICAAMFLVASGSELVGCSGEGRSNILPSFPFGERLHRERKQAAVGSPGGAFRWASRRLQGIRELGSPWLRPPEPTVALSDARSIRKLRRNPR